MYTFAFYLLTSILGKFLLVTDLLEDQFPFIKQSAQILRNDQGCPYWFKNSNKRKKKHISFTALF